MDAENCRLRILLPCGCHIFYLASYYIIVVSYNLITTASSTAVNVNICYL